MAIAYTHLQAGGGAAASGSVVITLSANHFTAGDMAVVMIAYDNNGTNGADTFSSISDSRGGTWGGNINFNRDPSTASSGVVGREWHRLQTTSNYLRSGDTITIAWTTGPAARSWQLGRVSPTSYGYVSAIAGTSAGGAATTATITSSSITAGDLILGATFWEYGTATYTADSDTTNGSWSAATTGTYGTAAAGMTLTSQAKVASGTATQTYNTGISSSTDYVIGWVQFRETPMPNISSTNTPYYSGDTLYFYGTNLDQLIGGAVQGWDASSGGSGGTLVIDSATQAHISTNMTVAENSTYVTVYQLYGTGVKSIFFNTKALASNTMVPTFAIRGLVTKTLSPSRRYYGNWPSTFDFAVGDPDKTQVTKITVSYAGTLEYLEVVMNDGGTANCYMKGVIYTDSGGMPGELIAVGDGVNTIADFGTQATKILGFTNGPYLRPGTYWAGTVHNSSGAMDIVGDTAQSGFAFYQKADSYTSPASSFGTPSSSWSDVKGAVRAVMLADNYAIFNLISDTLSPTYNILASLVQVAQTLVPTYNMRQLSTKTAVPVFDIRGLTSKTVTPTYAMRQLGTKTLVPTYSINTRQSKTLVPVYNLLNRVSNTLTPTYLMRQLGTKTLVPVYNILNEAAKDLTPIYNIRQLAAKSVTPTYDMRQRAVQTLSPVYDIILLFRTSKDWTMTYDVRQLGTKTLTPTYWLLNGPYSNTLTPTYDSRQLATKTVIPTYNIRQLATKTVQPVYQIWNFGTKTFTPVYDLRQLGTKSATPTYNIRQLGTKTVAPSYDMRQLANKTLIPSYNMRSLVNKPLTASYSMRELVRKELVPSYLLRSLSGKTITPTYSILNRASKTLSLTYNLRELVRQNLIPSYYLTMNAGTSITFTYAVLKVRGRRGYRIVSASVGNTDITRDILDVEKPSNVDLDNHRVEIGGPKVCQ